MLESLPQITFRNIPHSDAIEDAVLKRIQRLEKFGGHIISCRVVIERPQHRHRQGDLYRVRVDVRLPGAELVVNCDPEKRHSHEDVYVAVRDSFNAMKRRIEDHLCKRHRMTKAHESSSGFVKYLNVGKGYGFLQSTDGHEVYFHRNSLVGRSFEDLALGDHLRFVEEDGEKGPQASSVFFLHHEVA